MKPSRRAKSTLDDVAVLAGASRATVSRVLNGGVRSAGSIRPEVRQAILEAALTLDYAPNRQAQAMAAGDSRTVAILVSEIDDPGSASLVNGASRKARELGYSLTVGLGGLTAADELEAVRAIRGQRPRALIIGVTRTTDAVRESAFEAELTAYTNAGGRVAVIGHNAFSFDQVIFQNAESAAALASALVDQGYRRFAIVTGNTDHLTPHERQRGFTRGLAERGVELDPGMVFFDDFDRDGGYRAAALLVEHAARADLVFATSDAMALGVLARLRDEGIRVPTQMAVAGFDDVPVVGDLTPPLTTVRVPLETLAELALEQALGNMGAGPDDDADADAADAAAADGERRSAVVAGDVVVRASTPRRH